VTTKVSTIYDALVTRCAAVLTSSVQIPNAYELERAGSLFLDSGYTIAIGPLENLETELTSLATFKRTFGITLTRKCAATESDATTRGTIEKQMAEDMLALAKDFETATAISAAGVADCQYMGDSGIEFLRTDTDDGAFYVMAGVFAVTYQENLLA